jgi:subtilase family serine protease
MRWALVWRGARMLGFLLFAVVFSAVGVLPWSGGVIPPTVHPIVFHPAWSDAAFVSFGETPPTQGQCALIHRRCFNPQAEQNSYNLTPLLAAGHQGQGQTIIIVDAFGSETMRHDLRIFNNAFGLPHMCGEEGMEAGCTGHPTFSEFQQGNTSTDPQPGCPFGGVCVNATGQENHALWAIEVALDVEWAHSMAPMANILLVTTPTAETLGVQGFPDFFKAEEDVITAHRGSVISQSFASAEEAFNGGTAALLNLRSAFEAAQANHVTVFGSSGDSGTANIIKTPVKNPTLIPFPSVEWPASDPLVTGVGGTYECTNPNTGMGVDNVSPPVNCQVTPGVREIGWIASGGGFSHVFAKPSFQDTLPAGSTSIPAAQRGVPDISLQASSRTGVLIFITNPSYSTNVHDTGWYVIGGTSSGSPQWAGLIAVANEMNGGKQLGYINPALYAIASNPAKYAADFFDVTTGNNQADPTVPGFPATTGWDPVTGLGTPNAAHLLPDLITYVNTH